MAAAARPERRQRVPVLVLLLGVRGRGRRRQLALQCRPCAIRREGAGFRGTVAIGAWARRRRPCPLAQPAELRFHYALGQPVVHLGWISSCGPSVLGPHLHAVFVTAACWKGTHVFHVGCEARPADPEALFEAVERAEEPGGLGVGRPEGTLVEGSADGVGLLSQLRKLFVLPQRGWAVAGGRAIEVFWEL